MCFRYDKSLAYSPLSSQHKVKRPAGENTEISSYEFSVKSTSTERTCSNVYICFEVFRKKARARRTRRRKRIIIIVKRIQRRVHGEPRDPQTTDTCILYISYAKMFKVFSRLYVVEFRFVMIDTPYRLLNGLRSRRSPTKLLNTFPTRSVTVIRQVIAT